MNKVTTTETKRYQCRHIFTDGHRCGSICLRGEPFCYYHHTTRKPAPRQSFGRKSSFDLPLPEDRSAIQASIGIILQKIASNDLDSKRAGLLLYGLQIATLNLPKQKQRDEDTEEQVQEFTTHPELGTLAPETEIHEKKSSIALLLEEFRPKPAVLPQIQATATSCRKRTTSPEESSPSAASPAPAEESWTAPEPRSAAAAPAPWPPRRTHTAADTSGSPYRSCPAAPSGPPPETRSERRSPVCA
jgi:hypothetical protein